MRPEPVSRAVIVKAAPPPAVLSLNATDNIEDDGILVLGGAADIATFESGNHTYAAVAAYDSHGVQIINITNPLNITAAGSITGGITTILGNSSVITIFESDGHTYAAVAAIFGAAVQILNITNPSIITAADSITDDSRLVFNGPQGIATFESGGRTYAAVTGNRDDGVQILDVTDPYGITAAGSITNGGSDVLELGGPRGITTFESGGRTYAAVTANLDDGVQILDVTDPYDITAADSITDGGSLELFGTRGITTFESGGRTYAAVTGDLDDGVQILDVTDPYDITATDSITDGGSLVLLGTADIATFKSGGRTYAAVTAFSGDGVQILDVTYPYNITAAGSIIDGDDDTLELSNSNGIATFESGGSTYLAVAGQGDHGVQILRVDITLEDDTPPVITVTGPNPVTITAGDTYADEGVVCTDNADAAPVLVSNSTDVPSTPGTYV